MIIHTLYYNQVFKNIDSNWKFTKNGKNYPITVFSGSWKIDQQISRHLVHYATQIINSFLNSRISANQPYAP